MSKLELTTAQVQTAMDWRTWDMAITKTVSRHVQCSICAEGVTFGDTTVAAIVDDMQRDGWRIAVGPGKELHEVCCARCVSTLVNRPDVQIRPILDWGQHKDEPKQDK